MKQLVLDLLGCPECWGDFRLSVFVEQKSEIIEGFLECSTCGRRFPVIGGVPRVMPDHLMGRVYARYRPFFEKHAASFENLDSTVRGAASTEESYVEETQLVYSYQHTNWSRPQDPDNLMGQWRGFFFDRLAVDPTFFNGKVGLDAGCGEGRYLMVASEHCAEIVGMDLSEGVDRAYAKILSDPT